MRKYRNYKTPKRARQRANEYYQKNKEKCLVQRKKYYSLHKKKILELEKTRRESLEYGPAKREYDKQRYSSNPEKRKLQSKTYYYKNKDKRKHYLLKTKYGLSLEDYKNKWIFQNGKCEICARAFSESDRLSKSHSLVVDHNHSTSRVRGLLCNSCNRALGLFQDNDILIQNAHKYLTKWNSIYAT